MRGGAVAAVERIPGRRVCAFLSDTSVEAGISAELVLLDPVEETGEAIVAEDGRPPA